MDHLHDTRPVLFGEAVLLQGLVSRPLLNGKRGRARMWNGLRLTVELEDKENIAVKPEHVTRAPATTAYPPEPNVHATAASGQGRIPNVDGLVPCSGRDGTECPKWAWVRAKKGVCRGCWTLSRWPPAPTTDSFSPTSSPTFASSPGFSYFCSHDFGVYCTNLFTTYNFFNAPLYTTDFIYLFTSTSTSLTN